MAWTRTLAHTIAVEDMVEALLEYDSGAVARLCCNTIDFTGSTRFEVWGYGATISCDRQGVRITRPDVPADEFIRSSGKAWGEPAASQEVVQLQEPALSGHTAVVYDFSQALLEGRPPLVTGREGRNSLELANAIVLSSKRGKAVELPLDRGEYDCLLGELQAEEVARPSFPR